MNEPVTPSPELAQTMPDLSRALTDERIVEDEQRLVTVCDNCLMACCWHGMFMCDEAKYAGTVDKSVGELRALNREHPSYWGYTVEDWEANT